MPGFSALWVPLSSHFSPDNDKRDNTKAGLRGQKDMKKPKNYDNCKKYNRTTCILSSRLSIIEYTPLAENCKHFFQFFSLFSLHAAYSR
jgi:hypothetical protein